VFALSGLAKVSRFLTPSGLNTRIWIAVADEGFCYDFRADRYEETASPPALATQG
jgi:hypothetical protein